MAKIEEKVAELNTVLDGIGSTVVNLFADNEAQTALIQQLKDQVAAGNNGELTPELEQLFNDALGKGRDQAAKLAELDAKNPATGGGVGEQSPEVTPPAEGGDTGNG